MRDLTIQELKSEHLAGEIYLSPLYWLQGLLYRFPQFMLNSDARKVEEMPEDLGGQVFWRSNSPWKEPAGQIVSAKKARRLGGDCYYASQKKIDFEVRVYWEEGMGSPICRRATPKRMLGDSSHVDHPVIEVLQSEMRCFVIDFAFVDGSPLVLEMNPPQASGVYGDDVWLPTLGNCG